jgi:uncharacterized protein YndB with AHSA1/START domain
VKQRVPHHDGRHLPHIYTAQFLIFDFLIHAITVRIYGISAASVMEKDPDRTHRLHLHRTINASAERAFHACTDPEALSQWFSRDAQVDLQKGGAYSNADGDSGAFVEIAPPNRVTFTWDNPEHCPGSIVTLSFRDASRERVLVRLIHRDLRSEEEVNHMREGWQWALANLKLFLEEGRTITFEAWQQQRKTVE